MKLALPGYSVQERHTVVVEDAGALRRSDASQLTGPADGKGDLPGHKTSMDRITRHTISALRVARQDHIYPMVHHLHPAAAHGSHREIGAEKQTAGSMTIEVSIKTFGSARRQAAVAFISVGR